MEIDLLVIVCVLLEWNWLCWFSRNWLAKWVQEFWDVWSISFKKMRMVLKGLDGRIGWWHMVYFGKESEVDLES